MKNFFYNFIAVIVIVLCVMACGKDNQDGPTSRLSGKITYNGTNLNVPYFSTYQGHYADKSNVTDMQLQGYRDLREIMNAYSVNVVPLFKFTTKISSSFFASAYVDEYKINLFSVIFFRYF